MSDFRECENRLCGRLFYPNRPHQRFCSSDCRLEAWAANPKNAPKEPAQRVLKEPRRASRDGKGAHVYLTAQEIDFLENNRATFRSVADWQAHLNLGKKLARARKRLR